MWSLIGCCASDVKADSPTAHFGAGRGQKVPHFFGEDEEPTNHLGLSEKSALQQDVDSECSTEEPNSPRFGTSQDAPGLGEWSQPCDIAPQSSDVPKVQKTTDIDQGSSTKKGASTSRFEVQLARQNGECRWGILVEHIPGCPHLIIMGLSDCDGVVQEHNRSASEGKQLRSFDCISAINGLTDAAAMMRALKSQDALTISVWRPRRFTESIPTVGRPVKFSLKQSTTGQAVYIEGVAGSTVTKSSRAFISKGDVIIGVNGKRGNALDFHSEIQKSVSVKIHFLRLER